MKSKQNISILILFFLFYNFIYSNNPNIIRYSKENFSISIPNGWDFKKIDNDSLIFKSNFNNDVYFEIFKNVNTSGSRSNIADFSNIFIKKWGDLGFCYKTIKESNNQLLKFYENSNKKDKYILYYKREWNMIYTLVFHYENTKQETAIKKIINSFDVSIPFKQVWKTTLFKKYFFPAIALIAFIFFGIVRDLRR